MAMIARKLRPCYRAGPFVLATTISFYIGIYERINSWSHLSTKCISAYVHLDQSISYASRPSLTLLLQTELPTNPLSRAGYRSDIRLPDRMAAVLS
jgi:hypothetical protein